MRAFILNGSRQDDTHVDSIRDIIVDQAAAAEWDVTSFTLRQFNITHCTGCFDCWIKTPGLCRFNDDGQQIAQAYIKSDLVIFLTPLTFGGYSSQLKKALDRIICLIAPFFMKINKETHHRPRYEKYPMLMGVGVLDRPDDISEEIFNTLVSRNSLNFHAPFHVSAVVHNSWETDEKQNRIHALFRSLKGAI